MGQAREVWNKSKASKVALTNTSVNMVEQVPQNSRHLCTCPQSEL